MISVPRRWRVGRAMLRSVAEGAGTDHADRIVVVFAIP
jgi:hypothetical protein